MVAGIDTIRQRQARRREAFRAAKFRPRGLGGEGAGRGVTWLKVIGGPVTVSSREMYQVIPVAFKDDDWTDSAEEVDYGLLWYPNVDGELPDGDAGETVHDLITCGHGVGSVEYGDATRTLYVNLYEGPWSIYLTAPPEDPCEE